MALNLGSMFAWLSADTSGLDKGEARMKKFVRNTESGFGQVSKAASSMGRILGVAIGTETLRRAAGLADQYKGIQSRIKNVTRELGTYEAVRNRINSISLDSGSGLEGTAKLFANINRGSSETGATQKQALQLTETLNKLGVISGASAEQMKNGMLQFGQSMAAGIVRAEEWNSIMENIPEVGVRIAQGLGKSVGQLRLAILDGKVFSKDVFASLLKQSEGINAEFALMPKRMGQGFEAAKTGSMIFLSQLDEQLGLTTGIGLAFQSIGTYLSGDFRSNFFEIYNYTQKIIDGFSTWELSANAISGIYKDLGGDSKTFADSMVYAKDAGVWLADSIAKMGVNIKLLASLTSTSIANFIAQTNQAIETLKAGFGILWELVKSGGAVAAQFILEQFQKVISMIQSSMSDLANSAATAGFEKIAAGIESAQKSVAGLNKSFDDSIGGLQSAAEKSVSNIKQLTDEHKKQNSLTSETIGYLKVEKEAAMDLYESEIAAMNLAANERDRIFKEQQDQSAIKEATAQAAFEAEKARAAADPVLKGKKTKAPKAQKEKIDQTLSQANAKFDALEKSLMSELELENQYHKESLDSLNQAESLKIDSIIPYHELRERMEAQHQEALMEIEKERLDKRLNAWGDFFSNLSSLQGSESKKMSAIGRAAAMTQVLIDTARAAMSSYAYGASIGGPFLGLAFAAAAGVAGGVQLAAIRSAKATGGEVGMGGAYRVNEQGPEMLSSGGSDFLLMGSQGGKITPNSELGTGGSTNLEVKVNVINLPGQTATVEKNGEREITIRMAVDQTMSTIASQARNGNGVVVPAILAAGGMRRKAS